MHKIKLIITLKRRRRKKKLAIQISNFSKIYFSIFTHKKAKQKKKPEKRKSIIRRQPTEQTNSPHAHC